ncbi:MAG: hypothetical protein J7L15_00550 [Clostridiales bacterium]|nr:hypothetical protein [Clostridiales bacterium]
MERIINEEALFEDVAEGIANYLDISMLEVMPLLTDNMMEQIIDVMFEAESEELVRISNEIKKELKNDN